MGSAEFYDNFINYQVKSGINDRIYGLYKKLCGYGLYTNTSVLEIGCGIGTLTYLLLTKVKNGSIEAVDISPKSIEFAGRNLKAPNLSITAADILQFEPKAKIFERVLLFDVLEHIPLEQHPQIFQRIGRWMNDESILLINIPNPAAILYEQRNYPSGLQETDQPVYLAPLSAALASASLDIFSAKTYSVWIQDEYQFLVVKKRKEFEKKVLSSERNFFQKGVVWMKRKWVKLRYPYLSDKIKDKK